MHKFFSHRAVLRTLQLLVGAAIVGGFAWAASDVGRQVTALMTAMGASPPSPWPANTPIFVARVGDFMTHAVVGGVALAFAFAAQYAFVQLCLAVGSLVFALAGEAWARPRRHGARHRRS